MDARPRHADLPIGFRFRPTDEELLLHYLRRKALACPLPADVIPVADLQRVHPWDLVPADAAAEGRFFFHLPTPTRRWRAAGTGIWRPCGKVKPVVSPRCQLPVGTKRALVFCHRGGKRSDWVMEEYRLLPAGLLLHHNTTSAPHASCHAAVAARAMDWVVCRISKRTKRGHGGRDREEETEEIPSSPSSCVTDNSSSEEEDGGEQSSGSNEQGSSNH